MLSKHDFSRYPLCICPNKCLLLNAISMFKKFILPIFGNNM